MKKMFFYAAALCLTAVGFASCTAEDEAFPAAVLNITEEEFAVPAEGGPVVISLTAPTNMSYSVQTPEWIAVDEEGTVTRGVNASTTFKFNVAPAESEEERTGVIRVVAQNGLQDSVVVVQAGLEIIKVDNYSGTFTSLYDGLSYESTIGLIWDKEDESVVTICNLDPSFAAGGYTYENGANFVQGVYFPEENIIAIPFQSSLNLTYNGYDFYVGGLTTPDAADDSEFDHVYILLNEDKTTLTFPNALCTLAFQNGQYLGNWDMYAGGVVLTKVAE
jgi:hypothetical protein